MQTKYDVIIVGGGPAGIFAALELSQVPRLSTLLLEKGESLDNRNCPIWEKGGVCLNCSPCSRVSGLGGAGAFSDGKLTLSSQVGGQLKDYCGEEKTEKLIRYVDNIYLKFGASNQLYGISDEIEQLQRRAFAAKLRLIPVPIRHLGTENCRVILKAMWQFLSSRVDIEVSKAAAIILTDDGRVKGVTTEQGQKLGCRYLILAPGREGIDWLASEANRLGLTLYCNPVDVGARVEVPTGVLEKLTKVLYESKLEFYSQTFNDRVRTFCMCPGGEVTMESTGGSDPVITVNGHSYANRKSANTNFALLVSTTFTQPFREPIAYGKYLARLANILSGGVLVQRLGDLLDGQRSTRQRLENSIVEPSLKSATPGDLSFVFPYRHLKGIIEMLQAMDELAPGVASPYTLLYGVEVKFYSSRLKLNDSLESEIANMFVVGDGAGVSRGLVQASACGVVAARQILNRLGVASSVDRFEQ